VFKTVYTSRGATVYTIRQPDLRLFAAKMLRQGWCPHMVIHLIATFTTATLARLSDLHVSPIRNKSHSQCHREKQCVAFNVHEETYRTSHCDDCTGCSFLEVPYQDLVEIITKGGVPLISIEVDASPNRSLSLKIHQRRRFTRYTAVSHVWTDGLGNPSRNSLPICQLKALSSVLLRTCGKSNVSYIDASEEVVAY
jgi:hypothetical protein